MQVLVAACLPNLRLAKASLRPTHAVLQGWREGGLREAKRVRSVVWLCFADKRMSRVRKDGGSDSLSVARGSVVAAVVCLVRHRRAWADTSRRSGRSQVSLVVLNLRRANGMIFAQVGKLDGSTLKPACELPGLKQDRNEARCGRGRPEVRIDIALRGLTSSVSSLFE